MPDDEDEYYNEKVANFQEALEKFLETFTSEWDISTAEVVGTMQLVAQQMIHESLYEEYEVEEEEDEGWR